MTIILRVNTMVILFSNRKSAYEKEIIEILTACNGNYISDKTVCSGKGKLTVISVYKHTDLNIKTGIAVLLDDGDRFIKQTFPDGITGICDDTNETALKLFKQSGTPIISCGVNSRNTVTLSSMSDNTVFVTLQRALKDLRGNTIEPAEYKINTQKNYSPFSIAACVAILLIYGITPKAF